jgi:transposase
MSNHTATWTYVGLDVHADTITVAVAEGSGRGRGRNVGTIPNRPDSIRRAMKKLGRAKSLRVCYEAGPTGYALYSELHKMGIACEVIAPTWVPVRAGELTPIFVPDAEHPALRDLVRAREAANKDQLRARHRLSKFLLRLGRRRNTQSKAWGQVHWRWLDSQVFDHTAQEETFQDYKNEVEHATERVARLDKALDRAVEQAPPRISD